MNRHEQRKNAARQYCIIKPMIDAFHRGAKWADKTMVEKACKWITNNWREYVYQDGDGIVHFGHWEADFRKAMEE